MKKFALIGAIVALGLVAGLPGLYAQQWGCPWMAQSGSGHHGMMNCPWMGQGTAQYTQDGWFCPYLAGWGCVGMQGRQGVPLTREKAAQLLQDYLRANDNPNLKLGDVTEKGNLFEAPILTQDGAVVDRIQVDRNTWLFRSVS